eukprot:5049074-Prorocentrum_lima.AAC.1
MSVTWNQSTHVNWQRLLDAAYGGAAHWETVVDRQARRRAAEDLCSNVSEEVTSESTNVVVLIFQQQSVLTNWWAQAEA